MALINKLKAIANAIRSKTNKTEELTLEQMASEVSGIDVMQGLNFSEIYNQEQAQKLNDYYKNGITYAEQIQKETFNENWERKYHNNKKIILMPMVNVKPLDLTSTFHGCINLEYIPTYYSPNKMTHVFYNCFRLKKIIINTNDVTSLYYSFWYCTSAKSIILTNVDKVINFTNAFFRCHSLENLIFNRWATSSILIEYCEYISKESIKYIIWHALNGENTLGFENEGATSRTLKLHVTPYNSWDTWKLTKPSVEDCEYLGIDETEITKYGELTWEDIALNVKLITIAK